MAWDPSDLAFGNDPETANRDAERLKKEQEAKGQEESAENAWRLARSGWIAKHPQSLIWTGLSTRIPSGVFVLLALALMFCAIGQPSWLCGLGSGAVFLLVAYVEIVLGRRDETMRSQWEMESRRNG